MEIPKLLAAVELHRYLAISQDVALVTEDNQQVKAIAPLTAEIVEERSHLQLLRRSDRPH